MLGSQLRLLVTKKHMVPLWLPTLLKLCRDDRRLLFGIRVDQNETSKAEEISPGKSKLVRPVRTSSAECKGETFNHTVMSTVFFDHATPLEHTLWLFNIAMSMERSWSVNHRTNMPSKSHSYVELPESIPKMHPNCIIPLSSHCMATCIPIVCGNPFTGMVKTNTSPSLAGPFSPKKITPKH